MGEFEGAEAEGVMNTDDSMIAPPGVEEVESAVCVCVTAVPLTTKVGGGAVGEAEVGTEIEAEEETVDWDEVETIV